MWQYTFTRPGDVNLRTRESPRGKRPRSKLAERESEKTLWKYGSKFGNSTVEPVVIAITRGTNASSRCEIVARIAGGVSRFGASFMKTTTLLISVVLAATGAATRLLG